MPDTPLTTDQPRPDLETIEVELLLEAIWQRYGYDFRAYARATIERRLRQFVSGSGCASVSELIPKVLHDAEFFSQLARYFSIPVTELFRDPFVYRTVREKVLPLLRTWPHVKIWHAGCASGEEAYSMAIVLQESGLYERATLYATDFNDDALGRARAGIYDVDKIQEATRNYQQAGGTRAFSEYYHAAYNAAAMDASLRQRIVFSNHNLMSDGVFGEMHLVFCRNVLIYFNRELQNRVLTLLTDSLAHGGFLCLGTKEDLQFFNHYERYEVIDRKAQIYRKRATLMSGAFVVIGGSAGGLEALESIFRRLPSDFAAPMLIVEHLHPSDDGAFARHLAHLTRLRVLEPNDKTPIEAGQVYTAPANYHMLVERPGSISLSVDDRVNWSRPSIDVLFESAAHAWGPALVAVILSGANADGAKGLKAVKAAGGHTLAQDPQDAASPQMPQAAIDAGAVDEILRADCIAQRLVTLCSSRGPATRNTP